METNTPKEIRDAVTRVRYESIKQDIDDHEKRIRTVEEFATEFKLLKFLTMGGGLLSLINLWLQVINP